MMSSLRAAAVTATCVALGLGALSNPRAVEAGTALNQLCGAAGYGAGCIRAFKPSPMPRVSVPRGSMPRAPRAAAPGGGGMFGGMAGAIVGNLLFDMLTDAIESSVEGAAGAEGAAEVAINPERISAFQQAIQEQQRLQEARESTFLAQLLDRSANQLIGGSQDLGILEAVRAEAGRPFDGNVATGPDAAELSVLDVWCSPDLSGTAVAGSGPVPVGNQTLGQGPNTMEPVQCMGRLCAFPPGNVPAVTVRTIPAPAPSAAPLTPVSLPAGKGLVAEVRESGDRMFWAGLGRVAERAGDPQTQVDLLIYGWTRFGEAALPGMQREIAREGRGIYRRVVDTVMAETFDMLSDAFSGRWQEALEQSDTIGDRIRESLAPEFKLARLALSEDPAAAGREAGEMFSEQAADTAREVAKQGLLKRVGGPEWVQEGVSHSADVVDNWLKSVFPRSSP